MRPSTTDAAIVPDRRRVAQRASHARPRIEHDNALRERDNPQSHHPAAQPPVDCRALQHQSDTQAPRARPRFIPQGQEEGVIIFLRERDSIPGHVQRDLEEGRAEPQNDVQRRFLQRYNITVDLVSGARRPAALWEVNFKNAVDQGGAWKRKAQIEAVIARRRARERARLQWRAHTSARAMGQQSAILTAPHTTQVEEHQAPTMVRRPAGPRLPLAAQANARQAHADHSIAKSEQKSLATPEQAALQKEHRALTDRTIATTEHKLPATTQQTARKDDHQASEEQPVAAIEQESSNTAEDEDIRDAQRIADCRQS